MGVGAFRGEAGAKEPKVGAEPLPAPNGSFTKTGSQEPGAEKQGMESILQLPKVPAPHPCFLPSVFALFFQFFGFFLLFFLKFAS